MFLADFRCPRCQQRVAEIMAKMNGEAYSTSFLLLGTCFLHIPFRHQLGVSERDGGGGPSLPLSLLTTLIWAVVSGLPP